MYGDLSRVQSHLSHCDKFECWISIAYQVRSTDSVLRIFQQSQKVQISASSDYEEPCPLEPDTNVI